LVVAVLFLIYTWFATPLYRNYLANPVLFVIPLITVAALLATRFFIAAGSWGKAWVSSSVTIVTAVLFGVVALFPNIYPSSLNPAFSLTAFNSSSSPMTLKIMLAVALVFVPIVLVYQGWVYYLFKGKVTDEYLASDESY